MGAAALTPAGTAPASRLGQWSWALFDWSNQPYHTLITTFIFAPYFTSTVVGDPVRGQELWGYAAGLAGLIVALGSPLLGAMADAGGPRKPWIFWFQVVMVAGCALLWLAVPGADPAALALVLAMYVLATVGAEFSVVFNNAMLPGLTTEAKLGRLSGYAWALGYVAGIATLFVVLLGFSLPDEPLFGLDKATHEHDRMVGPFSALWIAIFVVPLFLFTPDMPSRGLSRGEAARRGLRNLAATLREARRFGNILRFLVARMLYNDGMLAIFSFGGIYAAGIFGWDITALGIFGIVITVFAAVGAMAGGWLDDRIGSKPTVVIAVLGLALATSLILTIAVEPVDATTRRETLLFMFGFDHVKTPDAGLFASPGERAFLLAGILIGIFGGPAQAASRTLLTRISPPAMIGEFFGLYAFSGKATAFVAPFAIAVVTGLADSQRAGLLVILVFLFAGLALMFGVQEPKRPPAPVPTP
jgi:UMF1 family MFS transporter